MNKKYIRNDLSVRHNLFLPAKDGSLSVYRIDGLERSEVVAIGTKYVAEQREMLLLGCANVNASVPLENGLRILGTETPHPRHANITNWPGGSADKLIAIKLAEAATLELVE